MHLIDRLALEVLKDKYFQDLLTRIEFINGCLFFDIAPAQESEFSEKEIVDLLRYSDILSNSSLSDARNAAYKAISHLADYSISDPKIRTFLVAVLSRLGNFPALKYLSSKKGFMVQLPFDREVERTFKEIQQRVPGTEEFFFTDAQYKLFSKLKEKGSFSFSGPTSMGKSFIIQNYIKYIINNNQRKKIVVLLPTKALLNQFTEEIKLHIGDKRRSNYKIYSNNETPDLELIEKGEENIIFILTPERLLNVLSVSLIPLNFNYLIIDEAHRLGSYNDSRSITYYKAVEKVVSKNPQIKVVFSSPIIENPGLFLETFNLGEKNFLKSAESPVAQNLYFADLLENDISLYGTYEKIKIDSIPLDVDSNSLKLVLKLGSGDQNIIYCGTTRQVVDSAIELSELISNFECSDELNAAISKIKKFVHKEYFLLDCLKKGVGFHYGNLPQEVRLTIEDLFKRNLITNLFCTSTLLEGVNLPAKNIFILTNKKGKARFDKLDFWNLAGRAGRLTKELNGNIICIREEKSDWNKKDKILADSKTKIDIAILKQADDNTEVIESLLLRSEVEKVGVQALENLEYISNVLVLESNEQNSIYKSPLIRELEDSGKEILVQLAKEHFKPNRVPLGILNSHPRISVDIQNNVFNYLVKNRDYANFLLLPDSYSYDSCLAVLSKLASIYQWKDSRFNSEGKLKSVAVLLTNWLNGYSLNRIINESIIYYKKNPEKFIFEWKKSFFIETNRNHINSIITKTIEDIEDTLRYKLEEYFENYYLLLTEVLGTENAGKNWSEFIEFGTTNGAIISLQKRGLSRHLANFVLNEYPNGLIRENNEIIDIKLEEIYKNIASNSMEADEIRRILDLEERYEN